MVVSYTINRQDKERKGEYEAKDDADSLGYIMFAF
jgi:hypothetical protein